MSLNSYSSNDKVLLAVDCIIFGFDKEELKVLLIKRDFEPEKGKWSLIGGFLKKSESLGEAGKRVLNRLTGLDNIFMEQVFSFSEIDRDPVDRTVSVAYYALIDVATHNEELTEQFSAQWFKLSDAPDLIFDHDLMVKKAIARLRRRATTKPIGFELLPKKFTMRQLQKLYECILGKELDKRNFISKVNTLDVLIKLEEKDMTVARKGSFLYQFDQEKYDKKVEEGFVFKL